MPGAGVVHHINRVTSGEFLSRKLILRKPSQFPPPDPVDFAEAEHERLVAALKASRAGTWRWNVAADIVEWDDALCDVYGIKRKEAPTNSEEFLALVHPDDRAAVWAAISACIEKGTDADYQFRAVVGGSVRWIYDRSALIRDADGNPAYMLGACLDITNRRRIEEERDKLLEKQTLLLRELILLSQKVAFWELGILDNFGRFVFRHEELRWITQ